MLPFRSANNHEPLSSRRWYEEGCKYRESKALREWSCLPAIEEHAQGGSDTRSAPRTDMQTKEIFGQQSKFNSRNIK